VGKFAKLQLRLVENKMKTIGIRRADERCIGRRQFILHSGVFATAFLQAGGAFAWFWSAPSWPEVKRKIRADHPSITQINIAQLQELYKKPEAFRLVDVRASAETAVSHLPGAVFYSSSGQIGQAYSANKNQNIVVYCSVGWRSAKIVSELQAMGFTQVSNLEGSIFEWANEGLPVFRGRERVKTVHPFDSTWQVLLKPELRALQ
jgi:rhodanese-related sulfurtransferase